MVGRAEAQALDHLELEPPASPQEPCMKRVAVLAALVAVAACGDTAVEPESAAVASADGSTPSFEMAPSLSVQVAGAEVTRVEVGTDVVLVSAQVITTGEGGELGRTVIFDDRGNQQTESHFVQGDPRRSWGAPDGGISWTLDETDGPSGLTMTETARAVTDAMGTWQGARCSILPLRQRVVPAFDLGFAQFMSGFGGVPGVAADLTHGGWLPGDFFDGIVPGGSQFILGATLTFNFIDPATGELTDIDNDGRHDVAFREIYYNDAVLWNVGSTFDVETIALHEAGHGLSQGHFGAAFLDRRGGVHFSPRAVMNAAYTGVQTRIGRTDQAGHCTSWASWGNQSPM
jgi:hypothetical protein